MRFIKVTVALLSCVTLHLQAQAQPGSGATNVTVYPLSLQETIRFAVEHNLSLQIERYDPQIKRFDLAGSYSDYDPTFELRGSQGFNSFPGGYNSAAGFSTAANNTWSEPFSSGLGGYAPTGLRYDLNTGVTRTSGPNQFQNQFQYRSSASVTLTQPLLRDFWTDQRRMKIQLNKRDVRISDLALELMIMDTATQAQKAYYDLIFARENIKVRAKALELAERLLAENKRRVEVGTMAPLDEKQAESQAATAQADLISARNQLAVAENVIKNLFTDEYAKWHGVRLDPTDNLVAIEEVLNLQESWNNGILRRPDYQSLKEELERKNITLRYDYNQLFPSLNLTGTVGRNGLGGSLGNAVENIRGGDFPNWVGGAVLSVPLSRTKERNQYAHGKAEKKQALLKLKKLEQDILVQVDDAVTLAKSNWERIDATRKAREFAEAALEAEQKKLETGRSTSFTVLQLQSQLTQARSAEIQALTDYNKSIADLYSREGTILERNRISLEVK